MAKKEKLTLEEMLEQALVKDEDKPYEVPENWVWTRLGIITNNYDGQRIPVSSSNRDNTKGMYPYYGASGVIDWINNYTHDGEFLLISEDGANLLARTKPIAFITKGKVWVNNHAHVISCENSISNKFLCYYMNSIDLQPYVTGSAQPKLTQKKLNDIFIPVPPLAEQQRIVALVESFFEKLDRAKELVENALDSFENRKSAILHKAFTGELTAKWRKDNGVDYDKDWVEKKLVDICCKITDGTHNSPPNFDVGDFMYVTAKNIKEYGVELDNITFIEASLHKEIYKRCNVEYGDVLYIKDGATTGIATVNRIKKEFSLLSSVALLKPNRDILDESYLAYNLNSPNTKKQMLSNMSGIAITRLTINKLKNGYIFLPPLSEQREIVRILDSLHGKEQRAKELCNLMENIDHMKKSILARAFRGELGTNSPEEESALELLKEVTSGR